MTAGSSLRSSNLRSRLDDWLNPIVVKELRQAVQSRFVVTALLVLLSIQIVAIGIYLLATGSWLFNFDAGRQVFMVLYGILLGVSLLFVPLYTAIRLISERSDTNVDLFFITTIKPRSIIAGKMFAAIVLTVLIFSACMPFMTFTYFLRGIDLPTIFVVLALGFLVIVTSTQMAIFIACIPVNRVFKVIFGLIALWIFSLVYFATMAGSNSLITIGVGSRFGDWSFWEGVIGIMVLCGLIAGLSFVLSVALITPLAANRALPVRVFVTAAWALSGGAILILSHHHKDQGLVTVWEIIFNVIFATALFVAVSERDRLGRRVLRSIPQSPLKRTLAFFFFSGSVSGLIWASLGVGFTLGVGWGWSKLFSAYGNHGDLIETMKWIGVMCLYSFCYALSAAFVRRTLLTKVGTEFTWIVGLILMILGSIIPFLTGYLFYFGDTWWNENYSGWLVGNPFGLNSKSNGTLQVSVAAIWAALVAAINLRWALDRIKSFRASQEVRGGSELPEAGSIAAGVQQL